MKPFTRKNIMWFFILSISLMFILFKNVLLHPTLVSEDYSESFIVRKLEAKAGLRPEVAGGFLHLPEEWAVRYGGPAYRSNPGWQGIVLASLYNPNYTTLSNFVKYSRQAFAFFAVSLMSVFILIMAEQFGIVAGFIVFCAYSFSPALTAWGANIYWTVFLSLSTGIICWFAALTADSKSMGKLLWAAGLLVFFKSLTGYEWISTVALNAGVPVIYFGVRDSHRFKFIFIKLVQVGCATFIGFISAFGVHIAQGLYAYHSFKEALAPIISRAYVHSAIGNSEKAAEIFFLDPAYYPHDSTPQQVVVNYLSKPGLFVPFVPSLNPLQLLVGAILAAILVVVVSKIKKTKPSKKWVALMVTQAYALLAVLSWLILMQSHSQVHININYVLFSFLFVPLVLLAIYQSGRELFNSLR